uniref:Uncharacterized protein n=1 Tax=viral metagenome TaxID=1070528 RepID=A0A6M3LKJ3_9ZZZZ
MIVIILGFWLLTIYCGCLGLIAYKTRYIPEKEYVPMNEYESSILDIVNTSTSVADMVEMIEDEINIMEDELQKRFEPFNRGFATQFKGIRKVQHFQGWKNTELNNRWNVFNKFYNELIGVR